MNLLLVPTMEHVRTCLTSECRILEYEMVNSMFLNVYCFDLFN